MVPALDSGALTKPAEAIRYLLAGTPPDLRLIYSQEMARKVAGLVRQVDFDIVQIEDSDMAIYRDAIPPLKPCRTILTFHDVLFDKFDRMYQVEKRPARKLRLWLHSRMMRRWEPHYAARFDRCIAMSARDRDLLLALNPRLRIEVIPNGVDTKTYQPLPVSSPVPRLIFVGNMDYQPNVDAVLHFYREIWPGIHSGAKDVEFWIVGINPRREIRQLEGEAVHVTGGVADVRPFYGRCSVGVVPLRAGGGNRLKIPEAMALGRPVVSTSLGCEGLAVVDGQHILIADSPEQFVACTLQLLSNPTLWNTIAHNARRLVEQKYDWDIFAGQLRQVYSELAGTA
jgi:glycosyltransferase involved in cell wall biosynthesis